MKKKFFLFLCFFFSSSFLVASSEIFTNSANDMIMEIIKKSRSLQDKEVTVSLIEEVCSDFYLKDKKIEKIQLSAFLSRRLRRCLSIWENLLIKSFLDCCDLIGGIAEEAERYTEDIMKFDLGALWFKKRGREPKSAEIRVINHYKKFYENLEEIASQLRKVYPKKWSSSKKFVEKIAISLQRSLTKTEEDVLSFFLLKQKVLKFTSKRK